MIAPASVEHPSSWASCELENHIEEVRTRNEELCRLLNSRPFDVYLLERVHLHVQAVTEFLDHCAGLHADDVLARAVEG